MMEKDIYKENGYESRSHYLESLCGEYGIDMTVVGGMVEILGENEDFDGLVCALEDLPVS